MDYRETMGRILGCVAEHVRDNPTADDRQVFANFRARMKELLDFASALHEGRPATPPAPVVAVSPPPPAPVAVAEEVGSQTSVRAQSAPDTAKKN